MRGRGGSSYSGRGGGSFRGGLSRGGFRGGRGGGRGGFLGAQQGSPTSVIEVGQVLHTCQEELVCKCTLDQQVPYFNGRIFLKNKEEIGKIDEILGPIHKFMFSVKMGNNLKASSFKKDTALYIDPNQILPLSRFLPKPPVQKTLKKTAATGARGGRGDASRGRGGSGARGGGAFRRGGGGRGGFSSFRGRGRGH